MTAQRTSSAPVTDEASARLLLGAPRPSSWFALHVHSNAEFVVEDALEASGVEAFLPTWAEETAWSDRVKTTIRPLFPGYLFVKCPPDRIHAILGGVPGIASVLPTNLNPQPVASDEIENVRRALATRLPAKPCAYVAGDEVLIEKGPMAGIKGIVMRTKAATTVIVRIEMLHRSVSVHVAAADVLKAAT